MSEGIIKDFLDEAKGRMQKSVDATKGEFQIGGRTFHVPTFPTPTGKAQFTGR